MKRPTVRRLRAYAIAQSIDRPATLSAAVRRLGFVQADPIRAPARAQDLILRHRVESYRAGDLERRYRTLMIEEDVLYAYGFMPRAVWRLLHLPNVDGMSRLEAQVLAAVREMGDTHPRQLDARFGRKRVVNAWGGFSNETKRVLEALHRRGLLRVSRRDKGIRVYQPAATAADEIDLTTRLRALVAIVAKIFAPESESRLIAALAPVRRRARVKTKTIRAIIDELVNTGALVRARVDRIDYVWPAAATAAVSLPRVVRFLAPFDPVVWNRQRFEHFWGWAYRFEAYTPRPKRVRGYYAMPLLWGDDVIGWANVSASDDDRLDVDVGFVNRRPRSKEFTTELDAEVERMREFLRSRQRGGP